MKQTFLSQTRKLTDGLTRVCFLLLTRDNISVVLKDPRPGYDPEWPPRRLLWTEVALTPCDHIMTKISNLPAVP